VLVADGSTGGSEDGGGLDNKRDGEYDGDNNKRDGEYKEENEEEDGMGKNNNDFFSFTADKHEQLTWPMLMGSIRCCGSSGFWETGF
jgi:hypothetical protein